MGQYISKRAEWKSESKLKQSIENETVLTRLADTIAMLASQHAPESQTCFAEAVQFASVIRPADFSGFEDAPEYIKTDTTTIVSVKTDPQNRPVFQLSRVDRDSFMASIRNLAHIHKHLIHAGDRRLTELRAMLENNRNVVRVICGQDGTPGEALSTLFKSLGHQTGAESAATQAMVQLMLVINETDLKLLSEALDSAKSASAEITVERVQREVELLQQFCASALTASAKKDKSVLTSIEFDKEYLGGPQAPPWRQVKGELAYITAITIAGDEINITASKRGYFQNKGYFKDAKGERRLDYTEMNEGGALFTSLVDLLRSVDAHFANTIDQQEYTFTEGGSMPPVAELDTTQRDTGGDASKSRAKKKKRDGEKTPRTPRDTARRGEIEKEPPSKLWQDLEAHPLEYRPTTAPSVPSAPSTAPSTRKNFRKGRLNTSRSSSGKKTERARKSIYSDSESEDDDLSELVTPVSDKQTDYQEYDKIQKLVRVLRSSTETATVLCLVHLLDCQLESDHGQMAVLEAGGLETLINLLTVPFSRCQLGALKVLKKITKTLRIQASMEPLEGIQPLCDLVRTGSDEIRCLAAETLGACSEYARNRRAIRQYGAIPWIVELLNVRAAESDPVRLARSAAFCLWSCSKSVKNQEALRNAGVVALLARLLAETTQEDLLIPVVGIIRSCADDEDYRLEVRVNGVIDYLVRYLRSPNEELQTQCAAALFRCAENPDIQSDVGESGMGLKALVKMLFTGNDTLLVAATGAVWKCAGSELNVARLVELGAISQLVNLVNHPNEEVQINAVGALRNCAKERAPSPDKEFVTPVPAVRNLILSGDGIPSLVAKLKDTNPQLLKNVTGAIGACALDANCLKVIHSSDGVRYLWSLLKHNNTDVVTSAAWAICPCIDNGALSGDLVRSFVGGLDLVVNLLKNPDGQVRAAICAVIANIAKDKDNLAVITDHGVVWMLADLTRTEDDHLRKNLAEAISRCAKYRSNGNAFGKAGAVPPLVQYLWSADPDVHRATARALHQLSFDANNCISMHEAGVVEPILNLVGATDAATQEAAAGCISNIRRLALCNERAAQQPAR